MTTAALRRPGVFENGPAPAVAILGPMTFQKEQSLWEYTERPAQLGNAVLVSIPATGDRSGEPRCHENPAAKVEDLHAALA